MRKILWQIIDRLWKPKGYKLTAQKYVREYWPEDLLLIRVFSNQIYWPFKPEYIFKKLVIATLPNEKVTKP